MTINLTIPDIREMKPRITVFGVGGAGGNAVNNMIAAGLQGVEFVVANTDAQALTSSKAERVIQLGAQVTEGLGAGSQPEVGRAAAEETMDEIRDHLSGAHMVFVTAGMGGGTGTGAAPVIARVAKEMGILTVGVVTKPFQFEGARRARFAEAGIGELHKVVDTLLIIPNQNLFRVANEKTTFADAFAMADQVLYSGVACITDLMVKEGLINLDFADVRAVMREMGKAMMGTGEASGEKRALTAAQAAIANPLIDDASMKGARGLLISITGGKDLTLYEVDEAATRIREEVDQDANIIVGATFDESLEGTIRVSVVATGIDHAAIAARPAQPPVVKPKAVGTPAMVAAENRLAELSARPRMDSKRIADRLEQEMADAQAAHANFEHAAQAAVAAAIMPQPAEQAAIKPSLFEEVPAEQAQSPRTPVAPQLDMRTAAQPRMPRMDELPLPAQAQIKAQRGELAEDHHPEKRRMSLMERLASVGLGGRREEAAEPPQTARAAMPQVARPRPAARAPEGRAEPVSEYARRAAPQGLDLHGRQAPVHNSSEDEQLDIPAFLRRQAN